MTDLPIDSTPDQRSQPRTERRLDARWQSLLLPYAALLLIFAVALGVRLYNVNWDDNNHLHPDERHMTLVANAIDLPPGPLEYFETDTSTMNPYNRDIASFVYGTFPLFTVKAAAVLLDYDNYDDLVLVGRTITGLVDALTVLFVFLIGRRLLGNAAGLIAAVLFATAPLAIQHAHFWVTDPWLTFFVAVSLYFSVRAAQAGGRIDYALAGLALGLGLASKLNALAMAPVIAMAAGVQLWPAVEAYRRERVVHASLIYGPVTGLLTAVLLAIIAFRVFQPYAFVQPDLADPGSLLSLSHRWVEDQRTQTDLLGGSAMFPPSVQWIGRESYVYPLVQMITTGMGPVFGVIGWLAFLFAAYRIVWKRDFVALLPVLFVLLYFGFMGRQFSLYLRYFLPLYPALAVLAGYALVSLAAKLRGVRLAGRLPLGLPAKAVVAALVVAATLPGFAYLSIYANPVTRVQASAWMLENWPAGTRVTYEHWDDSLPLRLAGYPDRQVQFVELPLYELDTKQKVDTLLTRLDQADYVVLSSNRLLNSIPRNPVNYPVTSRYYELLLAGELGFQLESSFTSPPKLFGITFPDNQIEESWSSYDHPEVLVFKKSPDYNHARVQELLTAMPYATVALNPAQADHNGLMLSTADLRTQQEGGTWTDVFSSSGIAATSPTLVWFAVIQIAALAATPLSLVLFRRLPDRGYLLAKPLGMVLLAYPVWLFVSLKLVHFDQATIIVMLGVLLAAGFAVTVYNAREIGSFLRQNWKLILFCELLFLAAFFLSREIRMLNPDLWHPARGGEKPMDLAYLTAITRSTTLPPYDPWFAGGYINYYYLGQFFTAVYSKLTTIPPEIAYNLAVPTFFAFTAGAAFSVAYNLAAVARRLMRRGPGFKRLPGWSLYAAGLLGTFLVVIAGNLDGFGQFADRLSAVSSYQLNTGLPVVDSVANSAGGLWQVVVHGASLQPFDFWRPSRMMPGQISITEFPQFSFLFADLHAHMIAIPFQLLALGIAAAIALAPRGERSAGRDWGLIILLALVVGSQRWINSWDYPTFLLVAAGAIVIGERYLEGGFVRAGVRAAAKGGVLLALSYVFYKPFADNYLAPVSGLNPTVDITPPHQYAAHFGVFLFIGGLWLLFMAARAWKGTPFSMLSRLFSAAPEDEAASRRFVQKQVWLSIATGIIGACLIVSLGLWIQGKELVALLLPALVLVAALAARELRLQRPDGGLRLFVLMLAGLGLGLSIGVDLVVLEGDIERMNTVFKFYLHIWVVFALVAAFAAWHLLFVAWRPVQRRSAVGATGRFLAKSAFAVLLFGALLYPLAATPARVDDRFESFGPTLDGMAYMERATYQDQNGPIPLADDLAGIEWLRQNVEGTPTIVEGRAELYRWGGRMSIYTGLPAVVGWDWHQRQQRGDLAFLVTQRGEQVDRFYNTTSVADAAEFLRQYNVKYVVLGRLERLYYNVAGLQKFQSGLDGRLTPVFQSGDLTIYEVTSGTAASAAAP